MDIIIPLLEPKKPTRPGSLWLDQALAEPATPAIRLEEDSNADIAIIGGGYVGLWTAIELHKQRPKSSIAILEADICGSGASGRNGGYVLSWWTKAPSLVAMWGEEAARELICKSEEAIVQLQSFCQEEGIDAEFVRSGWVWGAVSQSHNGAWASSAEACAKLGVGDLALLDGDDARRKSGGADFRAAIHDRTAALLHPGSWCAG